MAARGAYLGPGNRTFARLLIDFLHLFKFEYVIYDFVNKILKYKKKRTISDRKHFNFDLNFLLKIASKIFNLFLEILDFK